MSENITAVLDLSGCKSLGELHERIKAALDFPDYYGENWDAFRDSLRFDSPVEYVEIRGEETVADVLKQHLEIMHEIMQECKEERASLGLYFDYKIVVTLDLSECKSLLELHERIKKALDFPDYYGENWDAFYDLLCTDSRADKIIIKGINSADRNLQEQIAKMLEVIEHSRQHLEKFGIIRGICEIDDR